MPSDRKTLLVSRFGQKYEHGRDFANSGISGPRFFPGHLAIKHALDGNAHCNSIVDCAGRQLTMTRRPMLSGDINPITSMSAISAVRDFSRSSSLSSTQRMPMHTQQEHGRCTMTAGICWMGLVVRRYRQEYEHSRGFANSVFSGPRFFPELLAV